MLASALLVSVGGILALLVFIICASMSPCRRFIVAAFLGVPQFFLPGIPVSVAEIWFIYMAVLAMFDKRLLSSTSRAVWTIIFLATIYMLAQLWSVEPFSSANLLFVLRTVLFAFLAMYAAFIARHNIFILRKSIVWASPWIALQGFLTVVFALLPHAEIAFLRSMYGQILVGPDAARLFQGYENNVLDPLKAGGLFVNGNVGSMFCGVAFFVLLMGLSMGRSWWLGFVAILSLSGTVFSGSKTGMALAMVLPVACFVLYWFSTSRARFAIIPLLLAVIPIFMWIQTALPKVFPAYIERSESSLGSRGQLWHIASQLFVEQPFLGLGFGGWQQGAWSIARVSNLPPHNLIIAAWATGGILAALVVLTFIFLTTKSALEIVLKSNSKFLRGLMSTSLFAMLWIFFHGMADNTAIYGETRTMLLAALATSVATMPIGHVKFPVKDGPSHGLRPSTYASPTSAMQ